MSRSYSDTSCFVMAFGYYVINFLPYYEFLSEVNKACMVAYIPLSFLPRMHAHVHTHTHTHTHTPIHMRALVHIHNSSFFCVHFRLLVLPRPFELPNVFVVNLFSVGVHLHFIICFDSFALHL
jgi:hypothetical protein